MTKHDSTAGSSSDVEKIISGEAWSEYCDALKAAGQFVLDNSEADELERAEGFRYLARIARNSLKALDPAPLIPPTIDYASAKIGADNPDFMYGNVRVSGALSYRVRGQVCQAYTFNIGAFHGQLGSAQGLQCSGFLARDQLNIDEEGRFTLIASQLPPDQWPQDWRDEKADWLQMCDESNSLLIRQTILQPGTDKPAEFTFEVLDGCANNTAKVLSAERMAGHLGRSALMTHGIVQQFLGWTNDFKQRPNQISEIKPELLGMAKGDPDCQYNYGYFNLQPGEVLQVEFSPPVCSYWNIQLANHWMESFDSSDAVASINIASAVADEQGRVV